MTESWGQEGDFKVILVYEGREERGKEDWDCSSVEEHLPSGHRALGSIPSCDNESYNLGA